MSSSSEHQNVNTLHTPLPGVTIQELERMNDEEFWNYARERERMLPEPPSHAEYIECKLSIHACLITFQDLAEVLPPPHRLARLPGMPAWMAGIMAWRGETIAVVNLDLYLLGAQQGDASWMADAMLLIASQGGMVMGLLVPALGFTSTIALEQIVPPNAPNDFVPAYDSALVAGIYADLPILTISTLLTQLAQQIGMAAYHE
ncbi:MAG: chemotaxis protein CheW [Ktedonobacteraceae bacterium]